MIRHGVQSNPHAVGILTDLDRRCQLAAKLEALSFLEGRECDDRRIRDQVHSHCVAGDRTPHWTCGMCWSCRPSCSEEHRRTRHRQDLVQRMQHDHNGFSRGGQLLEGPSP